MGQTLRIAVILTAAVAAVCPGLAAGASVARAPRTAVVARAGAGGWGTAIEVPGTAALNTSPAAGVSSVSCGTAGNCSIGGYYTDSSGGQPFVDSQVSGKWHTAIEVPGAAALNKGDHAASTASVSCTSAGNCTAGGSYTSSSYRFEAFVDSQVGGKWGTAIEVPGTAALNAGGSATVISVSCTSAGNCTATGGYAERSGYFQVFVVSQINGKWGTAMELPGIATLDAGGSATVSSVSCGSAGNCSVGGHYTNGTASSQAFIDSQADGKWGTAVEVPSSAALNAGRSATVSSVSCGSAGNCTAGGYYTDKSGHEQAFTVSQASGKWDTATELPGTAALNGGGSADVASVSCASAGNCGASGVYTDKSGQEQAFVDSQTGGMWGTAIEVPGTAALNTGGFAIATSVSCASAGHCSAGGFYSDRSRHGQAFAVSQVSGKWGTAIELPGIAHLNAGGAAGVRSLSCAAAGHCSVGGYYTDSSGYQQAFVDSQH